MIDTDKYEGHAEGDWDWDDIDILMDTHGTPIAEMTEGWNTKEATAQLIADAPLLLEAYKELSEWKAEVERICRTMNGPNRDTALFIMTNEVEEE